MAERKEKLEAMEARLKEGALKPEDFTEDFNFEPGKLVLAP